MVWLSDAGFGPGPQITPITFRYSCLLRPKCLHEIGNLPRRLVDTTDYKWSVDFGCSDVALLVAKAVKGL